MSPTSKLNTQPQLTKSESNWQFESKWMDYLAQYGRQISIIIATLFFLCLFVYLFVSRSQQKNFTDYLQAQTAMTNLQSLPSGDPLIANGSLEKLQEILHRHPELHAKYDGLIAQTLLEKGDFKDAEAFAIPALDRLKFDHLPLPIEYSLNSLLIAKGEYNEALKNSLALKEKMIAQTHEQQEYMNAFIPFNLLRIAFLEQQLGNKEQEIQAWNELQKTLLNYPNATEWLVSHMQEGSVSLQRYIEERK